MLYNLLKNVTLIFIIFITLICIYMAIKLICEFWVLLIPSVVIAFIIVLKEKKGVR